ncbi:ABC transporter permease subunit [Streptomyces abikoensis]|uniref:amino acid ABC transporter permease n=1 Tax=Streptomyces abikoensis TaxID=97398 RepID=UPI003F4D268B
MTASPDKPDKASEPDKAPEPAETPAADKAPSPDKPEKPEKAAESSEAEQPEKKASADKTSEPEQKAPTDPPADDPPPADPPAGKAAATANPGEPEAIKAIPVRHYGRWISAVVVLALLGLIVNAFASANVHYSAIPDYIFDSSVVSGLGKTVLISLLAMLLGLVLGIVLAVMRLSKNPVTSSVSWLYIWFFRGTPVYVQLLLWFNLALIFPYINLGPIYRDEMSDFMTPFMAALLGLGLNEAAYMSEIVRAGIQSVDEGQTEAAHALGMSQGRTLRRIVLPQAMRVIVPPTGNEFINMLKTSSLAAAAAQYLELLRSTSDIGQTTGATVEMLFLAATWYLILTSVFSVGQFYLERRFARGALRSLPLTPWQKVRANLAAFGNRSKGGVSA